MIGTISSGVIPFSRRQCLAHGRHGSQSLSVLQVATCIWLNGTLLFLVVRHQSAELIRGRQFDQHTFLMQPKLFSKHWIDKRVIISSFCRAIDRRMYASAVVVNTPDVANTAIHPAYLPTRCRAFF